LKNICYLKSYFLLKQFNFLIALTKCVILSAKWFLKNYNGGSVRGRHFDGGLRRSSLSSSYGARGVGDLVEDVVDKKFVRRTDLDARRKSRVILAGDRDLKK